MALLPERHLSQEELLGEIQHHHNKTLDRINPEMRERTMKKHGRHEEEESDPIWEMLVDIRHRITIIENLLGSMNHDSSRTSTGTGSTRPVRQEPTSRHEGGEPKLSHL